MVVRSVWKSWRQLGTMHMESLSCKAKWPSPRFAMVAEEDVIPVVFFLPTWRLGMWPVPRVRGASASRPTYGDGCMRDMDSWRCRFLVWFYSRSTACFVAVSYSCVTPMKICSDAWQLGNVFIFCEDGEIAQRESRVFTEGCFCHLKSSN